MAKKANKKKTHFKECMFWEPDVRAGVKAKEKYISLHSTVVLFVGLTN